MTNTSMARSYLDKARKRLRILDVLFADAGYSDVLREAQESVEMALKGMLRQAAIEPPKWHDVGSVLAHHRARFEEPVRAAIDRLAEISARLRKDRELSFYGDIDFVPTEKYAAADASKAIEDARFVVSMAERAFAPAANAPPDLPPGTAGGGSAD